MKKIIFIFLFFLLEQTLFAEYKFPLDIAKVESFLGGNILVDTTQPRTFLLKPNWTNQLDVITTWQGIKKQNSIGKNLNNYQIKSSMIFAHNLLLLTSYKDSLYFITLDTNLNQISIFNLDGFEDLQSEDNFKIQSNSVNKIIALVNSKLYVCDIHQNVWSVQFMRENISDFVFFQDHLENTKIKTFAKLNYIFLEANSSYGILKLVDNNENLIQQYKVNSGDKNSLAIFNHLIFIKSSFYNANTTLVQVIDLNKGKQIITKYFDCSPELISFNRGEDGEVYLSYISRDEDDTYFNICKVSENFENEKCLKSLLPDNVFEPISLNYNNGNYYVVLRNGIIAYNQKGNLQLNKFVPVGKNFAGKPNVNFFKDYIVLSSNSYSEVFLQTKNYFWLFYTVLDLFLSYIVPLILLFFVIFYFRLYYEQKKTLQDLINLPSSGIFIILNERNELININQKGREFLDIDIAVPLQRAFIDYLISAKYDDLLRLFLISEEEKRNLSKRISIIKNNIHTEYLFNISPIWSVVGRFKGFVVSGYDITEQLERKKLSNWAQLAHDMQTNLLTIRLNAEQMKCEKGENLSRISKILFQVTTLQKRVRDIVTVGRSANLELVTASSLKLLEQVSLEFDKNVFQNVDIQILGNDFDLICDEPKLIRAIRNAVENGIKALPNQIGKIELSCWTDSRYNYFQIKDNGKGMNEAVKKKMLTPYFSTSKDGSGFGIGTIIIQQVIELHQGKLLVNSLENQGTELIFQLPKLKLFK